MTHVTELVLGAVLLGGAWYVRVHLFPWKDCPRCGGKRRNYSGKTHRDCGRCGSPPTGRVRRWGAGEER